MKVHSVWWATARASSVFPVPGGPYSNTPSKSRYVPYRTHYVQLHIIVRPSILTPSPPPRYSFWTLILEMPIKSIIFISLFSQFLYGICCHERNNKFWTISEREKYIFKNKDDFTCYLQKHPSIRTRKQVFSFWKCWTAVVYLWAALFRVHRRAQDASQATRSPKNLFI